MSLIGVRFLNYRFVKFIRAVELVRREFWFEALAQALSVLTFLLLAWIGQRLLSERSDCVHSAAIRTVTIEGRRILNCQRVSRLDLDPLLSPLRPHVRKKLRAIEALEPLSPFSGRWNQLNVEIVKGDLQIFSLDRNHLKIGDEWLRYPDPILRAMNQVYLSVNTENSNLVQTQVLADFLRFWLRPKADDEMRLGMAPMGFSEACKGSHRTVHLEQLCASRTVASISKRSPEVLTTIGVWSFLSFALADVVRSLPFRDQQIVLTQVWSEESKWPAMDPPESNHVEAITTWLESALNSYLDAFGVSQSIERLYALKGSMAKLDISAPLKWELTIDLRHTPAWSEILEQLKSWSRFRGGQRTLVFTPKGEVALPSGHNVSWRSDEIRSQKHVMVACHWPKPEQALTVESRQFFAEQSCGRLSTPFWEN